MSADPKAVDVLAVMDEMVLIVGDEFGNDPANRLRQARAAVAKLMGALKPFADLLFDPSSLDSPIVLEVDPIDVAKAQAALARCGGAS